MANYKKHNFRTEFDRKKQIKDDSLMHVVESAFEFTSIGEIDTMNERFQAEVIIESKWKLNPDQVENEDIYNNNADYNPKKHWNPRL